MNLKKTSLIALGIGALAVPAAAVADSGGHGHGHGHAHENTHGHGHNPTVMYVFKGTYDGDGVVSVNHGNGHANNTGLVPGDVSFDLSATNLVVADTNGDGSVTVDDVVAGDKVVVQARLPKEAGDPPFAAKRLVDQTTAPDDTGDEG